MVNIFAKWQESMMVTSDAGERISDAPFFSPRPRHARGTSRRWVYTEALTPF